MTVLERKLLESLALVGTEIEKISQEMDELTEKLEKATADQTFWYEAYCRQHKELEGLENRKEEI